MIINEDCIDGLKEMSTDSIDMVCTDPPYGYSFMGKDWDKAVPSVEVWQECLRVLKPGAFCFVMSAPRSDVQMHMIYNLEKAGFDVGFSPLYHTYASGFPKASNMGKLVDKRNGRVIGPAFKTYLNERRKLKGLSFNQVNEHLGTATNGGGVASAIMGNKTFNELPTFGTYRQLKILLELDDRYDELIEREEAERAVIGVRRQRANTVNSTVKLNASVSEMERITTATTPQAKALDGSYAGFQPKPAVEVIIVAMKPLTEKTYVDQALANGHGVTWLDDCRIPAGDDIQKGGSISGGYHGDIQPGVPHAGGRFPANLLVSDDVLNDGRVTGDTTPGLNKVGDVAAYKGDKYGSANGRHTESDRRVVDSGSYSRYFDLDSWSKTLPFLIVAKASKSEKNKGLESKPDVFRKTMDGGEMNRIERKRSQTPTGAWTKNIHPTVKPLKLMSYLITLGSRKGDTVLDPFCGSGTTVIAAELLERIGIGIEREKEYAEIAGARIEYYKNLPKQETLL